MDIEKDIKRKKFWTALIIFEITIFILFFGLWFNYESKWLKEDFNKKYDDYSYGIYQPVISKVETSTGCQYNFDLVINPEKIANLKEHINKIPN